MLVILLSSVLLVNGDQLRMQSLQPTERLSMPVNREKKTLCSGFVEEGFDVLDWADFHVHSTTP